MSCSLYSKALKRSLSVPCEIVRTIELDDSLLEIVKGNRFTKGCIGIHLNNPTSYNFNCSIEQAERDGFQRIYVYGRMPNE